MSARMIAAVSEPEMITPSDRGRDLAGMLLVHGVAVAVPILLLGVLLGIPLVGLVVAVVAGGLVTWLRMRDVSGRITSAVGARRVSAAEAPRLHSVADSVAMSAGIAPFELHVLDSDARNALIWRDLTGPTSFAITTGLLDALDRVELEAVLGHHAVVARDQPVDVVSLGAVLFGPVARGPLLGPISRHLGDQFDDRAIVLADLDGVRTTAYPPALVGALEKVAAGTTSVPAIPPALSGLCLAAPHGDDDPFAHHPSLADRIDLLREV